MKEIEELILLELKKQLNESPDGDDDYEATLQRALSDQSMTNQTHDLLNNNIKMADQTNGLVQILTR